MYLPNNHQVSTQLDNKFLHTNTMKITKIYNVEHHTVREENVNKRQDIQNNLLIYNLNICLIDKDLSGKKKKTICRRIKFNNIQNMRFWCS